MAFLQVDFFSYTLGMDSSMNVLLPERRHLVWNDRAQPDSPVLYLLHGHSDDHTGWIRKSVIELLVREMNLIVVMPNAHRSFYSNARYGHAYFDFLADELPVIVSNFFHASRMQSHNFVAGISMGGYGALKLALSRPEQFAGAASLSGAIYPREACEIAARAGMFTVADLYGNIDCVFGSEELFKGSENDLEALARTAAKHTRRPRLFLACGEEDPLLGETIRYENALKQTGSFKTKVVTAPGGHNWEFWNTQLVGMLQYIGIEGLGSGKHPV